MGKKERTMTIVWQDYPVEDVVQFFAKAFEPKPGQEIVRSEWFYDPAKGRMIFKLFVTEVDDE